MRSSSPVNSSPSSHQSLPSSHRTASRTYSKRVTVHVQKRKAQAALPSSDTEGSNDEEVHFERDVRTTKVHKMRSKLEKGSPSPKRVARWTAGMMEDEEEEEMVEESRPQRRKARQSKSGGASIFTSPTPSTIIAEHRKTLELDDLALSTTRHTKSRSPDISGRSVMETAESPPAINVHPPISSPAISQTSADPKTPPPRPAPKPARPLSSHASPRDLSALFAAVSPGGDVVRSPGGVSEAEDVSGNNGSGSGGRLARPGGLRRMLTKTQSLGAIPTSPSDSVLSLTHRDVAENVFTRRDSESGPSTPSRIGRTQSVPESPSKISPPSAPVMVLAQALAPEILSGGKARRTYGRNRTILAGEKGDNGPIPNMMRDERPITTRQESYVELQKKYEVDNSELEEGGSGNMLQDLLIARAPQPVSDLRSKGENRRFMDEVGYLADGIADTTQSMSMRRSSSITLLLDMQEDTWMGRMKICGQTEKIWASFVLARGDGDEILDIVCVLFLMTLLRSGSGVDQLLHGHAAEALRVVTGLLRLRDGLLDGTPTGSKQISSREQTLRDVYQTLRPPGASSSISTRCAASFLLSAICRAHWDDIASSLPSEKVLSKVLRAFASDVRRLTARFELYEKGLHLLPSIEDVDLDHILYCLRVISALILNSAEDRMVLLGQHVEFAEALVETVIACTALALELTGQPARTASYCVSECLQLLANLANSSTAWASIIPSYKGAITGLTRVLLRRLELSASIESAKAETRTFADIGEKAPESPSVPEYETGRSVYPEELTCLILAILTTMVFCEGSVGDKLARTKIDEGCTGSHACLRCCQCFDASPVPVHMVQLYLFQTSHADENNAGVMTGYLALLLSKLSISSAYPHDLIFPYLPGNNRKEKVEGLLSSLSELSSLQSLVHRKLGDLVPPVPNGIGDDGDDEGFRILEKETDVVETTMAELRDLLGAGED